MNMIKDESGYVGAIIILMGTILISFILVITILPVHDTLKSNFETNLNLDENELYTNLIQDRFTMAGNLGWKAPFIFIAIGFLFAVIKVIRRQQYTQYTEDEYR